MFSPLELTLLLLGSAVLGVVAFRMLHLPPMLGYLAVGILMSQGKLTADAAFDRLRRASNDRNQKLRDVAEDVILSGMLEDTRAAAPGTGRPARTSSRG